MTLDTRLAAALEAVAMLCADDSTDVAARPAMCGEPLLGLFSFLDDVVSGRLADDLVAREAAAWAELVATRWSPAHRSTAEVQQALDLLVDLEPTRDLDSPVEGLVPLARAALALRRDAGERPALWRRLHADGVWLAVLDADACPDGVELRLLTVRVDGGAFVLGASSENELASLLGDRLAEARLVHAPGHHLPRIWPNGHHLVLDPGTARAVVLAPAEMTGLPGGPMLGHAELSTLHVTGPSPTDWRHGRLASLADGVEGCDAITWRVLGDRCDALVIVADPQADPAPVMARLAERAPLHGFSGALAIPADTDLGRRLLEG